jgi:hypothetical protein
VSSGRLLLDGGGTENSAENSSTNGKKMFGSMYQSSLRHPFWVPEINLTACNFVGILPEQHRLYYLVF